MTYHNQCNIPNLDCMETSDLMMFWHASSDRATARNLFPSRPKGYTRLAKDLGNYAANKATAMSCRARGDIQTARSYEAIAENIYRDLPYFARW